jgi:Domain of unknown function (DUF4259)
MGAWGTAIFSDDIAADVRDDFKDKIANGKTPLDATNEMIDENQAILEDNDDAAVFWLSLAAAQWKLGRLVNFVKQKAIEIIDSGQDLERWGEDLRQLKQRKLVLEKLKVQLNSEQPAPKKIYLPFISDTILEIGDLVLYKHPSGKNAYLKVVEISEDKGGKDPRVQILDYFDHEPLNMALLDNTGFKEKIQKIIIDDQEVEKKIGKTFRLGCYSKRESEPVHKMKVIKKGIPIQKDKGTCWFVWWKDFDNYLEKLFKNYLTIIVKKDGIFEVQE